MLSVFGSVSGQQRAYIEKYKPLCDSLSIVYGIPSQVILGIAIHESGYGTSRVCKLLNNHFGIAGKNNLRKTHNIRTQYKYYPNDTESFIHFCNYLTARKYYKKIKGKTSLKLWFYSIGRAGYCKNPKRWTRQIMGILKRHKLV